ncbi:hypothetical protein DH2020_009421 [Rehmannia glutinosa]|uniref:RING-type domain-containing protein n=1 Tax=Rehmannia glutinosa TaxID=99300 RepID=A0ABR0X691_REHGL
MQGQIWFSGQTHAHLKISWIKHQINEKDSVFAYPPPFIPSYGVNSNFQKQTSHSPSSSGSRISPAVLFIIVILAVLFFISGLLHLLVRFLTKSPQSNRNLEASSPDALQRQLQQLFHLHDSGLDQAFIDALPVFSFKEVVGPKEPFDCAVCLCEFSETDQLRLLPICSHAFHINCIDTWLLSNSSCPLCRGALFNPGFSIENPIFDCDDFRDEDNGCEKRVDIEEEYVVGDANLRVALSQDRDRGGRDAKGANGTGQQSCNDSVDGSLEGKKISIGTKTDSYSVSKIWLWSKKGNAQLANPSTSSNLDLSWMRRSEGV